MSQNIIKIEPIPNYFTISWRIGIFCNYDCIYCPAEYHNDYEKPLSFDMLKDAWLKIYNKTKSKNLLYKLAITGGEPTANKSFLPFMKWLKEECTEVKEVVVTSNGSASLTYYKDLVNYVDNLSFSTHIEFMDEVKFFTKCDELNQILGDKFIVNIMNEYWNKDRIELYKEYLEKHSISYTVNDLIIPEDVAKNIPIYLEKNLQAKGESNIEQIL